MTEVITNSASIPPDPVLRLSVDQYHAMICSGILTEDDPVELLEGWLILKMPKNPLHSATTRQVRQVLENKIPNGWIVDSQEPITTTDSEPEPGVIVMRGDAKQYVDRHPGPEDLALVVEISGATLQRDRELKKRIYASSAIPAYWIVNLAEQQIEVYIEPSGNAGHPDYGQQRIYELEDEISLSIEDQQIIGIAVCN